MPGFLLHQGASVVCIHLGQAQPVVVQPRVRVSGQPVVVQTSGYTIAACGLTGSPNPPCTTATWTTAAVRVKVGGVPVLLKDGQAVCAPTTTGLNVLVTQTRVKGV